jgi:hypothetical protein
MPIPFLINMQYANDILPKTCKKGPLQRPVKPYLWSEVPLNFARRSKPGGLSILRFVAKVSAFRHWENEEKERTCLKGIRISYYGGLPEDLKLLNFTICAQIQSYYVGCTYAYTCFGKWGKMKACLMAPKYMHDIPTDYLIRLIHILH